jgi:mercuric reductase
LADIHDIAVIGAGSAGFSAAIRASELGARTALVGYGAIGGTCVNVGCVPSKTLIRAADALHQAKAASRFAGIGGEAGMKDWKALIAQKDRLVADLRTAKYTDLLPAYDGIDYMEGKARVVEDGVAVDGRLIAARKVVVATGSSAFIPDIPGLRDVPFLTSTTAMDMDRLPDSMLVLGAGYIGCELAQMFARMGVSVTLLCRHRLLPEAEPEIGAALTDAFRDEGIIVREGVSYKGVGAVGNGIEISLSDGTTATAERLLVATGRRPNTDAMGLAEAGVALSENGAILVDGHMRTTNGDIFAAGDVTGRDMFVYMAAHGARIAVDSALGNDTGRQHDDALVPTVVFTDPQAASVGLGEEAARKQGLDVMVSILPLSSVPRYIAARDTRGLIKLVAEAKTGRLLGAHILAPEGADGIQTAALAIHQGMTVGDLGDMVFPYLTGVEGLKLAAQTFTKDVAKLSCCA